MERRFRVRLAELLDDAHVPPTLLRGVRPRLLTFLQPFLDALQTPQQQTNAHHYVQGLLSDLAARMSNPSPICTTANARACKSSSAKPTGTTSSC